MILASTCNVTPLPYRRTPLHSACNFRHRLSPRVIPHLAVARPTCLVSLYSLGGTCTVDPGPGHRTTAGPGTPSFPRCAYACCTCIHAYSTLLPVLRPQCCMHHRDLSINGNLPAPTRCRPFEHIKETTTSKKAQVERVEVPANKQCTI